MPGNIVGEAWVAIHPDFSTFEADLLAGITAAMAKAQAVADASPITFRANLDATQAVAAVGVADAAMQAAAAPINFPVMVDTAAAIPEVAAAGAAMSAVAAAHPITFKMAVDGAGLLLATTAMQKLLGLGAGMNTMFGVTLPAAFSLLSLAGLGFEHVLTVGLGLVGSLAGALAGGLLLAIGAVGVAAVGMGSDFLVMRSTIADTKTLGQALQAIQTAQLTYGQNSAQAAAATQALNVQMQLLGNTAGVQAELGLAKAARAVNAFWDQATSSARVAAVNFATPFLALAYTYIPLIASAATQNFGLMTEAFKPLIAYLQGPATLVFQHLEDVFAKNLPTAIHALTQGIEFVIKTINFLSDYTGALTQKIDEFLTKVNSPAGFAKWELTMATLIDMFRQWAGLFVILAKDIWDVFSLAAGLFTSASNPAQSIVGYLTTMLTQLHQWLNLTSTKDQLHNLFELHKQEILALLALIPPLVSSLSTIYLTVAPALVGALVLVLQAIAPVLVAITNNAWGAWAVGLGLIALKMGILVPLVQTLWAVLVPLVVGLVTLDPLMWGIAAALAAVAGAAALIATHWTQVKAFFDALSQGNWAKVKSDLSALGTWIGTELGKLAKDLWDWATKNIPPFVGHLIQLLKDHLPEWITSLSTMLGTLLGKLAAALVKWAKDNFPGIAVQIGTIFATALSDPKIGVSIVGGLLRGIAGAGSLLTTGVSTFVDSFLLAFTKQLGIPLGGGPSVVFGQIGFGIIDGLLKGLDTNAPKVWTWFTTLPIKIQGYMAGAANWLWTNGVALIEGFWTGITTDALKIWTWFTQLPIKIQGYVAGAASWLLMTGIQLIQGLWTGITTDATTVWAWFGSLQSNILSYLPAPLGWLLATGISIIQGLFSGIGREWPMVVAAIRGIGPGVISAIGNLSNTLWQAGYSLLNGFWQGMISIWRTISGWISGLATWIRNNKGPIEVDRQLLVPHGLAIMAGLHEGLTTGFARVRSTVGGMALDLNPRLSGSIGYAGSAAPGLAVAAMATGGAGGSIGAMQGASSSVTINQSFYNNGGSMAEMQAVVRRENATLVTALRAGRR